MEDRNARNSFTLVNHVHPSGDTSFRQNNNFQRICIKISCKTHIKTHIKIPDSVPDLEFFNIRPSISQYQTVLY